jgi:putative FmdB family regulatory protein
MPTYQYECSKCGQAFEAFQSMKDPAFEVCPKEKCTQPRWGKGKVRRQVGTGAGLIFKGSGFYITDYRSESYKAAAKKDAPAAPAPAPKPDAKPPAAGASAKPAPKPV